MNPLDFLLDDREPLLDEWRWATVVEASPLGIRFDGEAEPLAGEPETLVAKSELTVGRRVYVHLRRTHSAGTAQVGFRALIMGAAPDS